MKGYYFITDEDLSLAGNIADVRSAVRAGVRVVQYRHKTAPALALFREASRIREICRHTLFLVNDRIDIALAVEADGVHLGQDDLPYVTARNLLGPKKIIGITVHNLTEARQAQQAGADYLGISPIFATGTKRDAGEPAGLELIRQIKQKITLPLVAIGGINLSNAPAVIAAGADAVCAISAVVTKKGVCKEILKFQQLFK